jgi:hypothetical protein
MYIHAHAHTAVRPVLGSETRVGLLLPLPPLLLPLRVQT